MTASRQASLDMHAVGRDRGREAELTVEARPHATQETEGANEDTHEAHDRLDADVTHQEPVEEQQEDTRDKRHRVVEGRQHGGQQLDEPDLEHATLGGFQRRGTASAAHGRSHGIGRRIHDLVNRARGQGEQEGTQLLQAAGTQQAQLDARIRPARDLNIEKSEADDAAQQRIRHVDGLDARQPRVTLRATEDAAAIPHGRGSHRVARRLPRQVAIQARHSSDDRGNRRDAQKNSANIELRGHLVARHPGDDRRGVGHGRHPHGTDDRAHHAPRIGQRMKMVPILGGNPVRGQVLAHRPISSAEPRWASTSRRRAASATGTPSSFASVCALAVESLMVAMPMKRSTGPW